MLETRDNKSDWSKIQMDLDSWGNYSDEEMNFNGKNSSIMHLKMGCIYSLGSYFSPDKCGDS